MRRLSRPVQMTSRALSAWFAVFALLPAGAPADYLPGPVPVAAGVAH
jgi:hypothetical protein